MHLHYTNQWPGSSTPPQIKSYTQDITLTHPLDLTKMEIYFGNLHNINGTSSRNLPPRSTGPLPPPKRWTGTRKSIFNIFPPTQPKFYLKKCLPSSSYWPAFVSWWHAHLRLWCSTPCTEAKDTLDYVSFLVIYCYVLLLLFICPESPLLLPSVTLPPFPLPLFLLPLLSPQQG